MDGSTIAILIAVVTNIVISAFGAGKLYQKVNDLSARIGKLEKKLENTDSHIDTLVEKVARIEGKLEAKCD